jgi:hypothetical protein
MLQASQEKIQRHNEFFAVQRQKRKMKINDLLSGIFGCPNIRANA